MPDNGVALGIDWVALGVAQVDFALNYQADLGITPSVIRLLAYFCIAFITGMDGYLLIAPYAVFCVVVMHLVYRSRQAKMARPVEVLSIPTAALVPNL
jgi:hypothetical protein